MKKFYNIILIICCLTATAFVGCTNAESDIDNTATTAPNTDIYRQLTFSAENDNDASRTHHNGETIVWSKGDRIRICYTKGGVWQNAEGRAQGDSSAAKLYASTEQSADSEHSVFRVTQLFKDTESAGEHVFYGLYPSSITKGNKPDFADSDNGIVTISIPQIQTPSATSFDSSADLMVSRSRDTYDQFPSYEDHISMYWTRLVAHGMITLKNISAVEGYEQDEMVQYVEFTTNSGVTLTGDFSLDIAGQVITATEANNRVRLSYADNAEYNTLFDADEDGVADDFVVWFATAPFTATDLTVTVGTNKATYTRTFEGANKTFVVNKRNKLGINMSGATRTAFNMVEVYELMTDASVLAAGKKVVIAAADANYAMATTKTSSYRNIAEITKNGNQITINENVEVFEIQQGTTDGTWAFYEPDFGYLQNSGSSSLTSRTSAAASTNWKVEITDTGIAKVKANSYNYYILYNTGVTPANFRTYSATSSARLDISLYHNVPSSTPQMSQMTTAPVITSVEEIESNSVQVLWEHDLTDMTLTGLCYSVKCTKEGAEDIVYNSITDTIFVVDNLAEGEWTITVTAYADGYDPKTSESANVTVIGKAPILTIEPTELEFLGSGGTQTVEVVAKNLGDNVTITAESDNNEAFSAEVNGSTIAITAQSNPTAAERSGIITVTATGSAATLTADIAITQGEGLIIYKKVKGMLKDFSGQYLIVYEEEDVKMAFNGSLSTMDAANNYYAVNIENDQIALTTAENNIYFTIAKSGTDYTIMSQSGRYVGKTTDSTNGFNTSTSTKYTNTIIFNGTDIDIIGSGGSYLRFNTASGQDRFRYYTSTTYTGQQPIQLYKLEGSGSDDMLTQLETPEISASVNGTTITVSWTGITNAANYTVTCGDIEQTVTTQTAIFEDVNYSTEYVITVVANPAADSDTYYASAKATTTVMTGDNPNVGKSAIDCIDLAFTGRPASATYGSWTKTSDVSAVEYAGSTAGDNASIQMRNSSSSSIITKTSIGKVKMVVITWNPNTAIGRQLDIYGKNSAYTAVGDVYSSTASTKGTKLGSIVCGTSTTLVIDGDYEFIGLRSYSGALYIDEIKIVWNYTPLSAPAVTATSSGNSINVSWNEVANAANYTVTCGDVVQTVTGTSTTFANLPYWSSHEVSVVANPASGDATYCFSPASTASVEIGANPTNKEYTFTILPTDFPTSITTNNVVSTATATDGSGDQMQVSWTSTGMRLNGGFAYCQANATLYNTTDLGTISAVTITPGHDNLSTVIGSTQQPTAEDSGGYFMIKASGSASNTESITVTFEK